MSQQVYRIRRAFLIPLGLDTLLLFCLLVISLMPQGSATERLVFAIFFCPSGYLFLECLFRRVMADDEGIVLCRLWRKKRIPWGDMTHVGGLSIHKKIYILLTTVRGFFVVSNAYEGFPELTERIVSHVDSTKVDEEVRLQAGRSPVGISHIVMAWIAAVFMVGIILIKVMPFVA